MLPSLGDAAQTIGACVLAFNAWQSWRNGRIARKALAKVEVVAQQTDGLTKQLVKITGEQKFDEGVKRGEQNAKET
jgi:threonine/homoserine/homoserine lactone efflux protein